MNRLNKINSGTLFYIALVLFEISSMFAYVNFFQNKCNFFANMSMIFLFLCCFLQSKKYSIKSLIIIVFLIFIFSISSITIDDNRFLLLLLFCLACKNMKLKDVLNFNWKCQFIFFIIVIIFYYLGMTDNYYMYRDDGTIRSSMGFSHPNTFGIYVFSIVCQFIYCNYKKIKLAHLTPIIALSILIVFKFSDSRSSAYSLIIIFLFTVFLKGRKKINNQNSFINSKLFFIPLILLIFSLVVSYNYSDDNKFMRNMNSVLSGRISASHRIMNEYDIKLFGQKLNLVSTKDAIKYHKNPLIIDNSYVKLMYQYGIVISAFFLTFYCIAIKKAIKKRNYILACMLIIYAIRGLTENIMFNIYGNYFIILFHYKV